MVSLLLAFGWPLTDPTCDRRYRLRHELASAGQAVSAVKGNTVLDTEQQADVHRSL